MEWLKVLGDWVSNNAGQIALVATPVIGSIWVLLKVVYYPYRLRIIEAVISEEQRRRERIRQETVGIMLDGQRSSFEVRAISSKEIDDLHEAVQKITLLSSGATSDIANYGVLLTRFFAHLEVYERRDKEHKSSIRTTSLYSFVVHIVDCIHTNAVGPVPSPGLWNVLLGRYWRRIRGKKPFEKYLKKPGYSTYSWCDFGPSIHPCNSESYQFLLNAISTHDRTLIKAAHRALPGQGTIERILYARGIYFPPILKHEKLRMFDKYSLVLVGYQVHVELGTSIKRVHFLYATDRDNYGLGNKRDRYKELNPYVDGLFEEDFYIDGSIDVTISSDVLSFIVPMPVAEDLFKSNRRRLEKVMQKQMADP